MACITKHSFLTASSRTGAGRPASTVKLARPAGLKLRRPVFQASAVHTDAATAATAPSMLLPAALVTALIGSTALALPDVAVAAPKEETETVGAKRTSALIEAQGTPGAAAPGNMKTNVPFQAPGINAAPRGPRQEQGTNVKRILKDAGRQSQQNSQDPDSKPFGISRGPLVRDAKRMGQPGGLRNVNREAGKNFKGQSPEPAAVQAVKSDPSKKDKGGYFILLDKIMGKR